MLWRPPEKQPYECARCHLALEGVFSLSAFTGELICLICKEEERNAPGYDRALKLIARHVRKKDKTYVGPGLTPDAREYLKLRQMRRADDGRDKPGSWGVDTIETPVPFTALVHPRVRGYPHKIVMSSQQHDAEARALAEKQATRKLKQHEARLRFEAKQQAAINVRRAALKAAKESEARRALLVRTPDTSMVLTQARKEESE